MIDITKCTSKEEIKKALAEASDQECDRAMKLVKKDMNDFMHEVTGYLHNIQKAIEDHAGSLLLCDFALVLGMQSLGTMDTACLTGDSQHLWEIIGALSAEVIRESNPEMWEGLNGKD